MAILYGNNFADFVRCVKGCRRRDRTSLNAMERLYNARPVSGADAVPVSSRVSKAAMGTSSGSIGGYTVPPTFSAKLFETMAERSFLLPECKTVNIKGTNLYVPHVDVETTQSAPTSALLGGIRFNWGFNNAPTETEPKLRQNELTAWDLIGYAVLSDQFVNDLDSDGEDALYDLFADAAVWYAEYAFLQGQGAGSQEPLGMLNAPCTKAIGAGRAGSGHIAAADISNMSAALLPVSWSRSCWACSPSALADIVKLSTFFLNQVPAKNEQGYSVAGTLVGRPLYVTDKLPSLGTRGDLLLFDPKLYVIGKRKDVVIDTDEGLGAGFQSRQETWRVWLRMDGLPLLSNTMTLQNGDVVAPFVVIPT